MKISAHWVLVLGALLSSQSAAEENLPERPPLPLPWLGEVCENGRLPALAGGWAIGCGSEPGSWRAQSLADQRRIEWPAPEGAWGLFDRGLIDLKAKTIRSFDGHDEPIHPISSPIHAPLVSDGNRLLFSGKRGLELSHIGSAQRQAIQGASPAPWFPPALHPQGVFWVQFQEGEARIWWLPEGEETARAFATEPGSQRHPISDGESIAWLGDQTLTLRNLQTGDEQVFEGAFHSNERLALSEGLLCWEALAENDIDLHCSNGLHLERDNHQRRPSLWREWLLFHEGEQALLFGPVKYTDPASCEESDECEPSRE